METATRSNDVLQELFPIKEQRAELFGLNNGMTSKMQMKNFLDDGDPTSTIEGHKPIADLFPHVTVLFLDIVGFSAWSSERDPAQVFTLLENLFRSFDETARAMKVFKVRQILWEIGVH